MIGFLANKVLEKCLDLCPHVGLPVSSVPALTQNIALQKWQQRQLLIHAVKYSVHHCTLFWSYYLT